MDERSPNDSAGSLDIDGGVEAGHGEWMGRWGDGGMGGWGENLVLLCVWCVSGVKQGKGETGRMRAGK
jgi:hypothetical protein